MVQKKNKAVLILASTGILLGICYTPTQEAKNRPSREFVTKVYARSSGVERVKASEARKQEILQEIRRIRKQIRLQAHENRDKNTINYGRDVEASYKLLMDIVKSKQNDKGNI